MSNKLEGKVALVTGGGRGLGEAICRQLARTSLRVVVADCDFDAAGKVAAGLRGEGLAAYPLELDVRQENQVREGIARVALEHGGLDVLINNAGVDVTCAIDDLPCAEWDRILATNLRGPFLLAKQALPQMRARGGGDIINIVSTAAKRAWANASAYHASKWGLLGFSHSLHVEARADNVRVTALICGGMRTPFLLERFPNIDLKVLQDPANVAATIPFLLSLPSGTVIPELLVLPSEETSWP
jgi:NAD(P)-dependent dehydrogenase (short-subunit alcohol dehydrogenase family)